MQFTFILCFMGWVQVTPGVILKSYTFSKPLDLSRFNGQKRHSSMVIFRLKYRNFIYLHLNFIATP